MSECCTHSGGAGFGVMGKHFYELTLLYGYVEKLSVRDAEAPQASGGSGERQKKKEKRRRKTS